MYGGGYDREARYIEPTIVRIGLDSPAMEDETFGPILWVIPVRSMDEAIAYVNSREKPLSMYIFTANNNTAERIIGNTSAGGVTVNATLFHCGHPGMCAHLGAVVVFTYGHPQSSGLVALALAEWAITMARLPLTPLCTASLYSRRAPCPMAVFSRTRSSSTRPMIPRRCV